MDLKSELSRDNELSSFFVEKFNNFDSCINDPNNKKFSWKNNLLIPQNDLSHIPKGSSLLEYAYNLFLRLNVAKNLQNDSFTSTTILFLDVLKDFEVITISDGFSSSQLISLEKQFVSSIENHIQPSGHLFIELACYQDYYNHLPTILTSSIDELWKFPTQEQKNELIFELDKLLLQNPIHLFSEVQADVKNNLSFSDYSLLFDDAEANTYSNQSLIEISLKDTLSFVPEEWFFLIANAYFFNSTQPETIERICIYYARFNLFLTLDLKTLPFSENEECFYQLISKQKSH